MNTLKVSITLSLFSLCTLGGMQAFAENTKVSISKINNDIELISFQNFEDTKKVEHSAYCNFEVTSEVPAYMRIKGSKIQPVCWAPGRTTSVITPIGEPIHFSSIDKEYKNAIFDLDRKKIR